MDYTRDSWFSKLRSEGYTGALEDMYFQYLSARETGISIPDLLYNLNHNSASIDEHLRKTDPIEVNMDFLWSFLDPNRSIYGSDPEYSYAAPVADGNGGLTSGVPVHAGKGLWGGPAYTNLFQTTPTSPELVVLSAQDYVLQMTGTGSVSCSYGTATEDTPLVFTALAGDTTFTPTDTDSWMLVATSYIFPIIAQTTTSAPAAGTSAGNGFGVEMDSRMLESLRGEPDGVELITNGDFDTDTNWVKGGGVTISGGVVTASDITGTIVQQGLSLVESDNYLITFDLVVTSGSVVPKWGTTTDLAAGISASGSYVIEAVFPSGGDASIRFYGSVFTGSIDNVSVQKLNPATGTLAALVTMGVGSDETTGNQSIIIVRNSSTDILYYYAAGELSAAKVYDNTTPLFYTSAWSRNEIHLKVIEWNGTQYRVGNKRYNSDFSEIDANIQWSSWVIFDGSFNPLDYLRFAYNSTVPIWLRSAMLYDTYGIDDSTIVAKALQYGSA